MGHAVRPILGAWAARLRRGLPQGPAVLATASGWGRRQSDVAHPSPPDEGGQVRLGFGVQGGQVRIPPQVAQHKRAVHRVGQCRLVENAGLNRTHVSSARWRAVPPCGRATVPARVRVRADRSSGSRQTRRQSYRECERMSDEMRMADEVDEGQARGEVARADGSTHHRPQEGVQAADTLSATLDGAAP